MLAGRFAVALDNVGLVAAERQIESLVRGMEDAVTVREPGGRIVYANPAAIGLGGAGSLEELRDTPLERLLERFSVYDADGRRLGADDLIWRRARWTRTVHRRPRSSAGSTTRPGGSGG